MNIYSTSRMLAGTLIYGSAKFAFNMVNQSPLLSIPAAYGIYYGSEQLLQREGTMEVMKSLASQAIESATAGVNTVANLAVNNVIVPLTFSAAEPIAQGTANGAVRLVSILFHSVIEAAKNELPNCNDVNLSGRPPVNAKDFTKVALNKFIEIGNQTLSNIQGIEIPFQASAMPELTPKVIGASVIAIALLSYAAYRYSGKPITTLKE